MACCKEVVFWSTKLRFWVFCKKCQVTGWHLLPSLGERRVAGQGHSTLCLHFISRVWSTAKLRANTCILCPVTQPPSGTKHCGRSGGINFNIRFQVWNTLSLNSSQIGQVDRLPPCSPTVQCVPILTTEMESEQEQAKHWLSSVVLEIRFVWQVQCYFGNEW